MGAAPFVLKLWSVLPQAGDDSEPPQQAAALYHAGRRDCEACAATLGLVAASPCNGDYTPARALVPRRETARVILLRQHADGRRCATPLRAPRECAMSRRMTHEWFPAPEAQRWA